LGYIFVEEVYVYVPSFPHSGLRKHMHMLCAIWRVMAVQGHSKVVDFGGKWKYVCDFLTSVVTYSLDPDLRRLGDTAS